MSPRALVDRLLEADETEDMPASINKSWIGVDLDGTLAEYHGWKGGDKIGKAVKPMLERVKKWIKDGHTVKIFTARVSDPENIPHIEKWLKRHKLEGLEITNVKDMDMVALYDDKCVGVEPNTGKLLSELPPPIS